MGQLSEAKKGRITPEMREVAREEGLAPQFIRDNLAQGEIIIPKNLKHSLTYCKAIGKKTKTKVNTNIGTSTDYAALDHELKKLRVAIEAGTDAVMDLSTAGDLDKIRRSILRACPLPLGTVPIYQAAIESIAEEGALIKM
ncbi:unnamed protein product, partial [marine sediment metagenome]